MLGPTVTVNHSERLWRCSEVTAEAERPDPHPLLAHVLTNVQEFLSRSQINIARHVHTSPILSLLRPPDRSPPAGQTVDLSVYVGEIDERRVESGRSVGATPIWDDKDDAG